MQMRNAETGRRRVSECLKPKLAEKAIPKDSRVKKNVKQTLVWSPRRPDYQWGTVTNGAAFSYPQRATR